MPQDTQGPERECVCSRANTASGHARGRRGMRLQQSEQCLSTRKSQKANASAAEQTAPQDKQESQGEHDCSRADSASRQARVRKEYASAAEQTAPGEVQESKGKHVSNRADSSSGHARARKGMRLQQSRQRLETYESQKANTTAAGQTAPQDLREQKGKHDCRRAARGAPEA